MKDFLFCIVVLRRRKSQNCSFEWPVAVFQNPTGENLPELVREVAESWADQYEALHPNVEHRFSLTLYNPD